jgi:hypothetical protein
MVHRPGSFLFFPCLVTGSFFLIAGGAFGQISFPGQYPPSQFPGQYPGNGGGTITRQKNQIPAITVNGILRKMSDDDMVVETDDKRIITLGLGITTKFYKTSGSMIKAADLQPGDHMSIDATQNNDGTYRAKSVTQAKVGTPAERAAASQPVDTSPSAGGVNGDGDSDRPRIRRSSTSSGAGDSGASSPASPPAPISPPPPPDPNDSGPPKIRRGVPPPNSDPPLIARNDSPAPGRPSIHAEEVNGVTRTPGVPTVDAGAPDGDGAARQTFRSSGDPVIDKAREAAFSFAETLPNYVVKQFTTRLVTEAAHGGQTSWRAVDTVSADVVSEGGKESYKNILVNGKAPKEAVEKSGSWSTGEYSSVLLDILSPGTETDFHNKRSTTIVNRAAYRYDFSVDQENSHWHVHASAESYNPEYTGAIWIDKENSRVLRIELSARNMPRAFPLDTVESSVDYDYVLIGDAKFLLPVHSEALSCERGTSGCSRNTIDFRNYKKFSADTSITFDAAPDK